MNLQWDIPESVKKKRSSAVALKTGSDENLDLCPGSKTRLDWKALTQEMSSMLWQITFQ